MTPANGGQSDRKRACSSGIPLQRDLARRVSLSGKVGQHPWKLEAEEVPAGDGFIDMVLRYRGGDGERARMAVEVKRHWMKNHERPMRLLFMAPSKSQQRRARTPIVPYRQPGGPGPPSLLTAEYNSTTHDVAAEHCLFEERKGNHDLDSVVAELLSQMSDVPFQAREEPFAFIPVIVTNAELRRLEIGQVNLTTGEIENGDEEGEKLPWLRYEKPFPRFSNVAQPIVDLASWTEGSVQSVFVVQASEFVKFLSEFYLMGPHAIMR